MYTHEKLARIKQEEMLREARTARLLPINPWTASATRKLAVAVGVLIMLACLIILAGAAGLRLPL